MAAAESPVPIPSVNVVPRRAIGMSVGLAGVLALGIGLYFWVDSRYPSLLKKLHSGRAIQVKGALSFDALMPVTAGMPLATRLGHTWVNWMWTNRIGMTFGVCFGAAMLTLLAMLPRIRMRSAAGNVLAGTLGGVPLGVCANCVAPIGLGLLQAGATPDTALATMISSPTMNVVVLAMAFALFPLRVALMRLAVPLVLLALVPLIVRKTVPNHSIPCLFSVDRGLTPTDTLRHFLRNLWRLALATVPLMILAGFLGAVVAEILPATAIPVTVSVAGILAVAVIGTFLPVPMAFDVAAAFVLMSRGVPLPYVVTLLCTLGAFGIYPMLILGRSLSWKTAAALFGAVMLLGACAGLGTALWQHSL